MAQVGGDRHAGEPRAPGRCRLQGVLPRAGGSQRRLLAKAFGVGVGAAAAMGRVPPAVAMLCLGYHRHFETFVPARIS